MLEEGADMVEITEQVLEVSKATAAAGDDGAGAISLFVGTTRDNFEGECRPSARPAPGRAASLTILMCLRSCGLYHFSIFLGGPLTFPTNVLVFGCPPAHPPCISPRLTAGKRVVRLEYEAYTPMALKEMMKICGDVRKQWAVTKIVILHRIGLCPIQEASVIIAVSSPHRKEAMEAVTYAIDTLKLKVPIWKKEVYGEGEGDAIWKANKLP